MRSDSILVLVVALCLLAITACSEEVDIFAEEEPRYIVFGVLDADASRQFIRVGRSFQHEGNGEAFARTYDPSLRGLRLELTGGGKSYLATGRDTVRSGEGAFDDRMHLYEFATAGEDQLQPGTRYTLRISHEDGLALVAHTTLPFRPQIQRPAISGRIDRFCRPTAAFEDSLKIIWRTTPRGTPANAYGFELRVLLSYRLAGRDSLAVFRIPRLIRRSRGCSAGNDELVCYELGKGTVLRHLETHFAPFTAPPFYQEGANCESAPASLSRACELEISAVDTALGEYQRLSYPSFTSFNTVFPTYSTLSGNAPTVGFLGAVSRSRVPIGLSECVKQRLRLNGRSGEPGSCE